MPQRIFVPGPLRQIRWYFWPVFPRLTASTVCRPSYLGIELRFIWTWPRQLADSPDIERDCGGIGYYRHYTLFLHFPTPRTQPLELRRQINITRLQTAVLDALLPRKLGEGQHEIYPEVSSGIVHRNTLAVQDASWIPRPSMNSDIERGHTLRAEVAVNVALDIAGGVRSTEVGEDTALDAVLLFMSVSISYAGCRAGRTSRRRPNRRSRGRFHPRGRRRGPRSNRGRSSSGPWSAWCRHLLIIRVSQIFSDM
jgi:hypothetical protein